MNNDASLPGAASAQMLQGDNPLGVAGLEFVEFSSPDPDRLRALFEQLGFTQVARHISKDVTLYRQGNMNFLVNADDDSFATRFAQTHGVGICAIGLRVLDAPISHERAVEFGAWDFEGERLGPNELMIPAIQALATRIFISWIIGRAGTRHRARKRSPSTTSISSGSMHKPQDLHCMTTTQGSSRSITLRRPLGLAGFRTGWSSISRCSISRRSTRYIPTGKSHRICRDRLAMPDVQHSGV